MKDRAPTYAEVMEAARRAAQEIAQEWPEWKRALSRRDRPCDASDGPRPPADVPER